MDVVRLTAALQLSGERIAHQFKARLRNARCHRVAVFWWRLNRGEVANAGEGQVQRARDRRSGEGHHVEFGADRLQPLFCRNAEAMLFIHNQEAESTERNVL